MMLLLIALCACSTNELENVETVKASYWIGNEKSPGEVEFDKNQEVGIFIDATTNAKELDEQKFIKTPPLLTYDLIGEGSNNKTFHLWITEDGEGFIQSLVQKESQTYRLEEDTIKDLTNILEKHENAPLLTKIEFED